jgi:hypothetical protein
MTGQPKARTVFNHRFKSRFEHGYFISGFIRAEEIHSFSSPVTCENIFAFIVYYSLSVFVSISPQTWHIILERHMKSRVRLVRYNRQHFTCP